ncbi:MAG: hypothetical protein COB67_00045 [SAR324 cluster bacterium]|uniref:Uncharacterized protein n=1 Tax=SAR324 cluster bacterium TaxID=2024889 RepID=A0A2A4TC27_9DELT|nr:MAG: hypothetical protein COB67_00045 [SAR324 cluster bacterium]
MKNDNVVAKPFTSKFVLEVSTYALIKLTLRGVTDFSALKHLESELKQAKVDTRKAVEVNGVVLIGERKVGNKGVIVSGWDKRKSNVDVAPVAKSLLEMLYKVLLGGGLSSYDLKTIKVDRHV